MRSSDVLTLGIQEEIHGDHNTAIMWTGEHKRGEGTKKLQSLCRHQTHNMLQCSGGEISQRVIPLLYFRTFPHKDIQRCMKATT